MSLRNTRGGGGEDERLAGLGARPRAPRVVGVGGGRPALRENVATASGGGEEGRGRKRCV
jgi:hypothetical protein